MFPDLHLQQHLSAPPWGGQALCCWKWIKDNIFMKLFPWRGKIRVLPFVFFRYCYDNLDAIVFFNRLLEKSNKILFYQYIFILHVAKYPLIVRKLFKQHFVKIWSGFKVKLNYCLCHYWRISGKEKLQHTKVFRCVLLIVIWCEYL